MSDCRPVRWETAEVGHLNLGAGRIAMMDITRIDNAVHDGSLARNPVLAEALAKAKAAGGRLHLLGLVSDGGVHSSLTHLLALIGMAQGAGVPVVVHAFLDGRDVQPGTAPGFIAEVESRLAGGAGAIGTVSGRYWGMDRDNRWERVQKSYAAIAEASGRRAPTAAAGIAASYADGKTDEFVEPFVVGDYKGLGPTDVGLHFVFRPDRAREAHPRARRRRVRLLPAQPWSSPGGALRVHDHVRREVRPPGRVPARGVR